VSKPGSPMGARGGQKSVEAAAQVPSTSKVPRKAEGERLIRSLFATEELKTELKKATGVNLDVNRLLDSTRFRVRWREFDALPNPTTKVRSELRELARQILKKKVRRADKSSATDQEGESQMTDYKKRGRADTSNLSTPPSIGKTPYKIPRISQAQIDNPPKEPEAKAEGENEGEDIKEDDVVEDESAYPPISEFDAATEGASYAAKAKGQKEKRDCPYLLFIHQGKEDRKLMNKELWFLLLEKLQEKTITLTLEGKESPDVDWTGFARGVGVIAPADEQSKGMLKDIVGDIELDGKFFRAWAKGERGKFTPLTIQIPATMNANSLPSGKILVGLAIKNKLTQGPEHMVVRSCTKIPHKHSRTFRFAVSDEVLKQIYDLGGTIRLGVTQFTVYFKGNPLGEQEVIFDH